MQSQDLLITLKKQVIKLRNQGKKVSDLIDELEKTYTSGQDWGATNYGVLATRLTQARKAKGLSRQEVADRAGLHINSVYFYERGTREPSLFNLECLADIYEVSIDWLLGREKKN